MTPTMSVQSVVAVVPDDSLFEAKALAIALTVGVVTAVAALVARRVAHRRLSLTAECARCRATARGAGKAIPGRCSECGADLTTARSVRLVNYERRSAGRLFGVAVTFVCVLGVGAVALWFAIPRFDAAISRRHERLAVEEAIAQVGRPGDEGADGITALRRWCDLRDTRGRVVNAAANREMVAEWLRHVDIDVVLGGDAELDRPRRKEGLLALTGMLVSSGLFDREDAIRLFNRIVEPSVAVVPKRVRGGSEIPIAIIAPPSDEGREIAAITVLINGTSVLKAPLTPQSRVEVPGLLAPLVGPLLIELHWQVSLLASSWSGTTEVFPVENRHERFVVEVLPVDGSRPESVDRTTDRALDPFISGSEPAMVGFTSAPSRPGTRSWVSLGPCARPGLMVSGTFAFRAPGSGGDKWSRAERSSWSVFGGLAAWCAAPEGGWADALDFAFLPNAAPTLRETMPARSAVRDAWAVPRVYRLRFMRESPAQAGMTTRLYGFDRALDDEALPP